LNRGAALAGYLVLSSKLVAPALSRCLRQSLHWAKRRAGIWPTGPCAGCHHHGFRRWAV